MTGLSAKAVGTGHSWEGTEGTVVVSALHRTALPGVSGTGEAAVVVAARMVGTFSATVDACSSVCSTC